MNYSVSGLRKKLTEKVLELGIDSNFKENPAFTLVLAEIDGLIGQMNMGEVADIITIGEGKRSIFFDWNSPYREKYSIQITSELFNS